MAPPTRGSATKDQPLIPTHHVFLLCLVIMVHVFLQVQRTRMDSFCSKHDHLHKLSLPLDASQRNELYRHLIFDDKEEVIYCFVEKAGCTNMKRLMFVNMGLIPEDTISWEWVDNTIYLEKALKKSSFARNDLTSASRLQRIRSHFKFMIVRNPLERLVSGYRNKIEPPLETLSSMFPYYIQREIVQLYHPQDLDRWLESNASYPLRVNFEDFVRYLVEKDNADINPHFRPMIDTCHPCEIRYDFYADFRSLGQDVDYIIRKIHAKPKYYRDQSLHSNSTQTKSFLGQYYSKLPETLRHRLFQDWRSELDFYYHLYPDEKNSHVFLLGVNESL